MGNKRALMHYYKQRLYGGRGAFARAVDFVSLRLMGLLLCYLHFSVTIANMVMAGLMSLVAMAFATMAGELIKSIRLDRFIRKERKAIALELTKKRLLVMPLEEQHSRLRAFARANPQPFREAGAVFSLHRITPVTPDDVLAAVAVARKRQAPGIILFHQGPISKEAMTLAEACEDIKVTFLSLWDILTPQDMADLAPGDKEIDEAILARLALGKKKRKDALSRPFSQGRTGRYLLCAAGLFAASFFVAYPIYYRLMAALCITFGAMAYVVGQAESTAAS